jgi:hypothetical protein
VVISGHDPGGLKKVTGRSSRKPMTDWVRRAPEARLREIVGTTGDRTVVERFDLRGHDSSWHSHRPE